MPYRVWSIFRIFILTLLAGLIVSSCPASAFGKSSRARHASAHKSAPTPLTLPDMVKGSDSAPVTLIEYGSATCSHCAKWFKDIYPEIDKSYIKTGKVKYIFREVLTDPIDLDFAIYMLGRCASYGANLEKIGTKTNKAVLSDPKPYFTILDGFWTQQESIIQSGDATPALHSLSEAAGMTVERGRACLKNETLYNALGSRMNTLNSSDNITGTPTFLINGKRFDGETSTEALGKALDEALKSTTSEPKSGQ